MWLRQFYSLRYLSENFCIYKEKIKMKYIFIYASIFCIGFLINLHYDLSINFELCRTELSITPQLLDKSHSFSCILNPIEEPRKLSWKISFNSSFQYLKINFNGNVNVSWTPKSLLICKIWNSATIQFKKNTLKFQNQEYCIPTQISIPFQSLSIFNTR